MNNDISKRRAFIQKLSAFSAFGLLGFPSIGNSEVFNKGGIINPEAGEVRFIGNERKAKVLIKVSKTDSETPEMSLLSEVIPPGDGIPVHYHSNEEEFLFIQKGSLEITLGEKTETGKAGSLIYVPKKVWHGFKNTADEAVILFFGYSPAGFEDYFRAIGTPTLEEDLGFSVEDWIQTNKKYGVVYQ